MKYAAAVIMLIIGLALGGCETIDRRSDLTFCPVHGQPLRDVTVRDVSVPGEAIYDFRTVYLDARGNLFPYAGEPLFTTAWFSRSTVSVCDACLEARKQWMTRADRAEEIHLLPVLDPNSTGASDLRQPDDPKECPLHHVILQEGLAPIEYGDMGDIPAGFYETYREAFPYARTSIMGGCSVRQEIRALVRYCRACRNAEADWLKLNHWNGTPPPRWLLATPILTGVVPGNTTVDR